MAAEAERTRILETTPTYVLAEFGRCLITDWRLQPNKLEFDRRNEALMDLASRFPGACGYLEMIESTSKPPSSSVRKGGMEAFRTLGPNLSCMAVVIHGAEFRVTLVRAVLTGLTFLVPQIQPLRIFKQTQPAADWMQGLIAESPGFERRFAAAAELLRPQQPAAHAL